MPEIVSCPHCDKKLKVPDNLLGRTVKCPGCQQNFLAEAGPATDLDDDAPPPPKKKRVEEDVESRPRKRPLVDDVDDDDDLEDDRPDDRPKRKKVRGGKPHRGALILTLGILGLACCPFLAPVAMVMGKNDLAEIDARRMNPEGRGLTNVGRILGIIGTVLLIISLVMGVISMILRGFH